MKLVTGATGRIGNMLVKKLNERGEKVRVMVRKSSNLRILEGLNVEVVYGDLLDEESLIKAFKNVETVFHLAGLINISENNEELTMTTNIRGVENVVKACRANNVKRLIYTSSTHAFSLPPKGDRITEITPLISEKENRGIYDKSKAIATKTILELNGNGLNIIVVCPSGVIGPNDFEPSFFGKSIIEFIKNKGRFNIDGGYNYVDVRDLIDGIISAYEKGQSGEIYILSGERISQKDYAEWLKEFVGVNTKTVFISNKIAYIFAKSLSLFNKDSLITPYSISTLETDPDISNEKAKRLLGFKTRSAKESLRDQYLWFREKGFL